MLSAWKYWLVFILESLLTTHCAPTIYKGSTPSGGTFIAVSSSSDPEFEKHLTFNLPYQSKFNFGREISIPEDDPENVFEKRFGFATRGGSPAGSGRGFVTTSNFSPFSLPLFMFPFGGPGFNYFNSANDWTRSIESLFEPDFGGNGEVKSVAAVNDNGHVYGKVNTFTFGNERADIDSLKHEE